MAPKKREKKEWGEKLLRLCGRDDYSEKLKRIILNSRADSTHRGYERWVREWINFAKERGEDPYVPSEMLLANWLAEVAGSKTMNTAISAIQGAFELNGSAIPARDFALFPRLRKGSRREAPEVNRAAPMTLQHLDLLQHHLSQDDSFQGRRLRALILLTFHAMLRVGEALTLKVEDVKKEEGGWELRLFYSKTDDGRIGQECHVVEGRATNVLREFIEDNELLEGHVFRRSEGAEAANKPYTYSAARSALNKALAATGLAGYGYRWHSFRAGAATSAAAGGVKKKFIMMSGRWRSDRGVKTYIEPTLKDRQEVSRFLEKQERVTSKSRSKSKKVQEKKNRHGHKNKRHKSSKRKGRRD